jgi:RNA polymerase sigma factor (sigma-70 family)
MEIATVGEPARGWKMRQQDAWTLAELKAGDEDAYTRLIAQYHRSIYGIVYRILEDPTDAPDTIQEVFLKVFYGLPKFNGESGLKAWMYRIAINEARNRRRWFFRHKVRERSIEPLPDHGEDRPACPLDSLADASESPFAECRTALHCCSRLRGNRSPRVSARPDDSWAQVCSAKILPFIFTPQFFAIQSWQEKGSRDRMNFTRCCFLF